MNISENNKEHMMKRRWYFFAICLILCFFLCGCFHLIEKGNFSENSNILDREALSDERYTDSKDYPLRGQETDKTRWPAEGTAARKVCDRVFNIMSNLRETGYVHYQNKTMDEENGIYKYDCSGFVGEFILKYALPDHYKDLVENMKKFSRDERPKARDFYDYFNQILSKKIENRNTYWHVFTSMEKTRPGDIIVAKYDEQWRKSMIRKCKSANTGHVMIAWSYPVFSGREYSLYVVDSSGSGHGDDTRKSLYDVVPGTGGIGMGMMWYGVNQKERRPVYYRWSSSKGCRYTLRDTKTNCDGQEKDLCCVGRDCDHPQSYYQRLEGIIMARPMP